MISAPTARARLFVHTQIRRKARWAFFNGGAERGARDPGNHSQIGAWLRRFAV
jgi:hypothetical protein